MVKKVVQVKFLIWCTVLSFAFVIGCTKPPTEEIIKAEKAVAEAKQQEADLYVQDIFMKAEESLAKAKDLVAGKNYKEAKKIAEETVQLAEQSKMMTGPNKEKMKAETEQIIVDIQESIDEFKTSVAKAIRMKAQINREELQGLIGKWEIGMVDIKEQLRAGKIRHAHDQLISIKDQIKSQEEGVAALMEAKAEKK